MSPQKPLRKITFIAFRPFTGSVKSDTPFFIKNLVFSGITPLLKIKKQ